MALEDPIVRRPFLMHHCWPPRLLERAPLSALWQARWRLAAWPQLQRAERSVAGRGKGQRGLSHLGAVAALEMGQRYR